MNDVALLKYSFIDNYVLLQVNNVFSPSDVCRLIGVMALQGLGACSGLACDQRRSGLKRGRRLHIAPS